MSQDKILSQQINNRLILKNTLYLYFRMFLIMAINLYTVRAILDELGVTDYGIYNAVGGVVGMFSFINGTLTTSAQRYFSTYLAKSNTDTVRNCFFLNSVVTFAFAGLILIVLETLGLWFLNSKMTIPEEKLFAANVVYQFSIFTVILNIIKIPYDALIIAKERMKAFAMIGIIDAFLKLSVALILTIVIFDRLIAYGALMLIVYAIIAVIYIGYCIKQFQESKLKKYWNKLEFKELMAFSSWHFFGSISAVIRSHGINLLLNVFFAPAINAARGIAFQVNTAVSQFSTNFSTASRPQIYKSYAAKDYEGMSTLVMRTCTLCFFLYSIIVFPLIANVDFILGLWLKNVPEYATLFTQLVLLTGLIECANTPLMAAALCNTDIKKYTILVSFFTMLNLPLSYIVLKLGGNPQSTMIISACIALVTLIVRAKLIAEKTPIIAKEFYRIVARVSVVSAIILGILLYMSLIIKSNWWMLVASTSLSIFLIVFLYAYFVFTKADRITMINIIHNKLHRK